MTRAELNFRVMHLMRLASNPVSVSTLRNLNVETVRLAVEGRERYTLTGLSGASNQAQPRSTCSVCSW